MHETKYNPPHPLYLYLQNMEDAHIIAADSPDIITETIRLLFKDESGKGEEEDDDEEEEDDDDDDDDMTELQKVRHHLASKNWAPYSNSPETPLKDIIFQKWEAGVRQSFKESTEAEPDGDDDDLADDDLLAAIMGVEALEQKKKKSIPEALASAKGLVQIHITLAQLGALVEFRFPRKKSPPLPLLCVCCFADGQVEDVQERRLSPCA